MLFRLGCFLAGVAAAMLMACGGNMPASSTSSSSPAPSDDASSRIFPDASWLYAAPTGDGVDISSLNALVGINTHNNGFDFPVQTADGSNGATRFTDSSGDSVEVPIPAGGFVPSTGGWGADDGHLTVVDTAHGNYYDFWKLLVNASGQPTSTVVGKVVQGSLSGDGTPGTTAAGTSGAAGDLMPGELDNGIHHALECIVPVSWNSTGVGTQFPAQKTDGTVSNGPVSEGGKIGIAPSVDLSSLNVGAATRNLMRAFQQYGCAIVDQTGGGGIAIYSNLPNLDGEDMSGMNQFGSLLRYYN